MRALVTGGAGFIGSFLADKLLAEGYEVTILDSLDPQVHPEGPPDYLPPAARFLHADVRDPDPVSLALDGADVVIHCAAAVGVAQSLYQIQRYVDVNVGGTARLLQTMVDRKQFPRKLIILTSMTGYGEGMYRRPSDGKTLRVGIRTQEQITQYGWEPCCLETGEPLEAAPTPEDAALLCTNIYALTKRYQEELALSVSATYGFPVACMRMFNVYGPRQSLANPYTGVLAIFLSRLLAGQQPVVYEDGRQTRDFISVHDIAHAVMLAIARPEADGQIFNLGSGMPRPIGEIAGLLARLVGREELTPRCTEQFRSGDIRHCYADITKAQQRLGFVPQTRWEDGLAELIAWSGQAETFDGFDRATAELRAHGLLK